MDGQGIPTVAPGSGGAPLRRLETLLAEGLVGSVRRTMPGLRRPIHHEHVDAEFNLVVRGGGTWTLDGHAYDLRPGHLIWFMPHCVHQLVRGPGLVMWVVLFQEGLLKPQWADDLAAQPSRMLAGHDLIELDHLLTQVAQDSDEPDAYNAGVTYILMRALRASRDRPAANLKPMHPAVTRALMLMRQEAGPSSLSDLAAEAGVAAPYLSRLLVEHTGRSFVDWRNRVRLDQFIDSYQPGSNLLTAALDAGFGSYTRFHHIFTEIIGCPPSEWMAKVDKGELEPRPRVAAPVAGYGMPTTGLLSARQRWTPLAALVSPSIRALIGENFANRVVAATPPDRLAEWEAFDDLEARLSDDDIERFLGSLAARDPDAVADYALILGTHDFPSAYASVCREYGVSPSALTALVAGLMMVVWVATKPLSVNREQGRGIRRQVERALSEGFPRIDPATARDAYVAMVCQYVVVYRAAIAARSSGDPRLFDHLGDTLKGWCVEVLGRDICDFELTDEGFVAPAVAPPEVRARRPAAALSLNH